jgi:hypothetical protein
MKIRRLLITGIVSGLFMGVILFIAGAVFSRLIYGPQMAPSGKFDPEELNAWYFIWTKLVIGVFFGLVLTIIYDKLPLQNKFKSGLAGLKYGFVFWLAMSLWNISHPLIYGSFESQDRLFWLVYSLFGFLALGYGMGWFYRRYSKKDNGSAVYELASDK